LVNKNWFSRGNFTRKYADGRQKKGGDLYVLMLDYRAGLQTLGTPRPQPSIHAKMRAKGIQGPAYGTKARKKYARQKTIDGIAQKVKDEMVGSKNALTITD